MLAKSPSGKADDRRRELARQVRRWKVEEFHSQLVETGLSRLYVVYENGEFQLSHPKILTPVQAFLELSQDFGQHEAIFIGREDGIPTLFFAFVHDTRRGLSQGGLRFSRYPNLAEVLVDGLRLSQGMTRKNALAGLWWGGGKGILPITGGIDSGAYTRTPRIDDEVTPERREIFSAYGRFVAGLGGVYYTAEDVGTNTPDMNVVLSQNRFTTCISSKLGGSGNPSPFTARGVLRGMQAAWLFLTGSDNLRGVRVAIQGAGNVGAPLIALLDEAGAELWVSDIDHDVLKAISERYPRLHVVNPDEIYDLEVDVFAPCAIGRTINVETIPRLKTRLVCGAANNILKEKADARRLQERKIAFVPDYVCNRMGITNCADEWHGYLPEDIQLAAERVFPDSLRVLKHARNLAITSSQAADELADIAASELHPLLGYRGRRIVDRVIEEAIRSEASKRIKGEDRVAPLGELPFEPLQHEPGIRMRWEREGFNGTGPRIAAAPITTASRPNLATVFSAALMDVQARAIEMLSGEKPHRIIGSDHGGHALQFAVERSLPHERDQVGRSLIEELCRDLHGRNDSAIREQLHQMGVGFDPRSWLDPMLEEGARASEQLFFALSDAKVIAQERRLAHHCPQCATVLMASDVDRSQLELETRYRLKFVTRQGSEVEIFTFYPELVVGAVALAVRPGGPFGALAGQTATAPVDGGEIPVLEVPDLATDAEILVPSYSQTDYQRARNYELAEQPPVYDVNGQVRLPDGTSVPGDEARERILASFGDRAFRETGSWKVDIQRCGRCESITHPRFSNELYVRFDRGIVMLRAAIASGSVRFSHDEWRKRVINLLDNLEPWCISRQLWWGNPIPTRPGEVLSTWFSLAAWSLQGAGWPADPAPRPIERVFVDPDLLERWVVPSLLVSLALTGRPVFHFIEVHGSLHVVERRLAERGELLDIDPDEERFLFRTIRRPMRRRLGNVVEPETLIGRFGADALRLGYLLCLSSGSHEVVVAAETQFRHARNLLRRFLSKLDGLFRLLRQSYQCGEPRFADRWIVSVSADAAARARDAFAEGRLADAAQVLVAVLESYVQYANVVAARRSAGQDLGAVRAASTEFLSTGKATFGPICPFMFDRLETWLQERGDPAESAPPVEPWLVGLVEGLRGRGVGPAEIGTPNSDLLRRLQAGCEELSQLARKDISVTATPKAGSATMIGPVVLVHPGSFAIAGDESKTEAWYRGLHPNASGN